MGRGDFYILKDMYEMRKIMKDRIVKSFYINVVLNIMIIDRDCN